MLFLLCLRRVLAGVVGLTSLESTPSSRCVSSSVLKPGLMTPMPLYSNKIRHLNAIFVHHF